MRKTSGNSLLLGLTAGVASLAFAADAPKGPNTDPESKAAITPAATAVRESALADELAAYGYEHNDPVALIQAAKIRNSLGGSRPLDAKPTTEGGTATSDSKTTGRKMDSQSLLARAEALAGDNAAIKGLIADARGTKSRGAEGGPKEAVSVVPAGGSISYVVNFRGAEPAMVAAVGDGDTDLDLFIQDEFGNVVCTDRDYTDRLFCQWHPRWTGPFRITVKNYGRVYNRYYVRTN